MRTYTRVGLSVLASYGAGFLGSIFIDGQVAAWYASLAKPWFNPPSAVFLPVWLVLYAIMSIAVIIIWNRSSQSKEADGWVLLYFVHLLANAAWTLFFFGFHAILIALIDILILDIAVLMLMFGAWKIDRRATYLLMPYLAWILFATLLNISIWYLN